MTSQPLGPADYSKTPRYAGPPTFGLLPRIDEVEAERPGEKIDVKVIGIPFDAGVSYRPGARFGPAHIRQSSKLLRPYNQATNVHPFTWQQVADCGDLGVNPFDIEEAITTVEANADAMRADGAKLLTLGGDHTLALPNLRSLHKTHGKIAVLHFDAHLDTWDTYFGAPYTHGTPFRRASEEGLIDMTSSMHIGIRGPLYGKKDLEDDEVLGFQIIRSDEYQFTSVQDVVARMRKRLGDAPVYLSVDIDVLDPAAAPGTGTTEAGGMTSRAVWQSAHKITLPQNRTQTGRWLRCRRLASTKDAGVPAPCRRPAFCIFRCFAVLPLARQNQSLPALTPLCKTVLSPI